MSLLFFLPLILAYFSIYKRNLFFISFVIMALIAGLRYNTLGFDYSVYEYYFYEVNRNGNIYNYEIGYYYLNRVFGSLGLGFRQMVFVISILLHFSLYKAFINLGRIFHINPAVILLFFVASGAYYWVSYTLTRQSLSVIYLYFIIHFMVLYCDKIKVIVAALGGVLFHVSSLFYLLIANFRNNLVFLATLFLPIILITTYSFFPDKYYSYIFGAPTGMGYFFEGLVISFLSLFVFLKKANALHLVLFKFALVFLSFSFYSAFYGSNFQRLLTPLVFLLYIPVILFINIYLCSLRNHIYLVLMPFFVIRLHFFILGFGDYGYPYKSIFFN